MGTSSPHQCISDEVKMLNSWIDRDVAVVAKLGQSAGGAWFEPLSYSGNESSNLVLGQIHEDPPTENTVDALRREIQSYDVRYPCLHVSEAGGFSELLQ